MLAALLTVALFLAWSGLGLATLVALGADVKELRIALTAPVFGTALMVVPLFVLSNAGLPMDVGARPVSVVLLVGAVAVLAWRRPRLSVAVFPVLALSLIALLLLGRPMFEFGFDWIANANGDMAYYVLAATHLMGHGLQSGVDIHALAESRDLATSAQGLHLRGLRPGTEIALAGLAATTGRSPLALYMPMSIAIAMGGVCATGALAMQASRRWWAAAIAAALFVASPMAGYGVVQQLLPQNWGLALAVALFAWLMRPEVHQNRHPRVADLAVIGVLVAALFVVAYEVAAVLILAYGLYVVVLAARRQVSIWAVSILWSVPVVVTALVVNTFLPRAFDYLTRYVLTFGTSRGFHGLSIFPYAIAPTALPGAAGLRSLFAPPTAPHMGQYVLLAIGLFAGVFIASAITTFRGSAAGVTLLAGFAVGVMLARNGNDFGLFKLYMYMQPFVAATVAVFLSGLKRWSLAVAAALIVVVVGAQLPTLNGYVRHSFDPIDLRHASEADLLPKFRHAFISARVPVVTVTDHFTLGTLEAAAAGEKRLLFLGRSLFRVPWTRRTFDVRSTHGVVKIVFRENADTSLALTRRSCLVSLPTGSQLALNRRSLPDGASDIVVMPCRRPRNVLAFVVSSLGQPFTLPDNRRVVSFWQLERDPWFPHGTFSGFGRYALFQIFGPTSKVRLALDFTTSPIARDPRVNVLPPAAAIGAERVRFPLVGSGSARVVSPPLRPRIIGGRPYVVLDMGRRGRFPPVRRPGVTGIWGKSAVLDPRSLTSFVRDVSLVSPAQYRDFRPPMAIRRFPADLANPNLEYSGISEDGWVAAASYVQLAGGPPTRLAIHAVVPPGRQEQRVRIVVNGRVIASRNVEPGLLDLTIPLPASSGRRKIELRWLSVVRLPLPDGRTVTARLTFLGLRN